MKSETAGDLIEYSTSALGQLFKTGFDDFYSPIGVGGLAKESDGHIEILAVYASVPGTGQFKKFIAHLKNTFRHITVWEVWNPQLESALIRYGFKKTQRTESNGEKLDGFVWP